MPKKRVTPRHPVPDAAGASPVAGWQATGASLAVAAGGALLGGFGTLAGAVVLAPVVHALVRLRAAAPAAPNVAGLVTTTLGRRIGTFTVVLQTIGYAIVAVLAALTVGIDVSQQLVDDPGRLPDSWLWPLVSVAALALGSLLIATAADRIVAGITAVLAIVGLLTFGYLALAVIATTLTTGRADYLTTPEQTLTDLAWIYPLAVFATGLAGFDVITTRHTVLRSVGRPTSVALGATVLLALTLWYADHVGLGGGPRLDAHDLGIIALELYPRAGQWALAVGSTCLSVALLLALLWGIARLVRDVPAARVPTAIVGVMSLGVLVVVPSRSSYLEVTLIGATLLFVVYAVVVEASARLGDSTVIWWSRLLTPAALAAIVLLALLDPRFSLGAVVTVVVVAVLIAVAALAAATLGRARPD